MSVLFVDGVLHQPSVQCSVTSTSALLYCWDLGALGSGQPVRPDHRAGTSACRSVEPRRATVGSCRHTGPAHVSCRPCAWPKDLRSVSPRPSTKGFLIAASCSLASACMSAFMNPVFAASPGYVHVNISLALLEESSDYVLALNGQKECMACP